MNRATSNYPWLLILAIGLAGCGGEGPGGLAEVPAEAGTPDAADRGPLREPGDPDRLYCNEHELYEDECFYCHPELLEAPPEAGGDSDGPGHPEGLFCGEHRLPEIECGICQPALADRLQPGEGLKIRLLSPEAARRAGVVSAEIRDGSESRTLTVPGELRFNRNRLIRITPQEAGVVRAVHVDLGREVAAGAPLVEISSPAIAEAKAVLLRSRAEELAAREQFEREASLHAQGISSARERDEARVRHTTAVTARRAAGQRLLDLGFRDRDVAAIERTGAADSRLMIRAPIPGTIVEREVVVGDVVAPGNRLLSLCDLDSLWLDLAVPEAWVSHLSIGAPVTVRPPGHDRPFTGRIIWIAARLDPDTRLARVRAGIPNPERHLRAGTYVQAGVVTGTVEDAVAVGRDAVHRFGGNPFVFLELESDLYEVRRVDLGGELEDRFLVTAGLEPSDRLVVARSFLIKSEFQKSRLGAGCVD